MARALRLTLSALGLAFFIFMLLSGLLANSWLDQVVKSLLGVYLLFVLFRTLFFFFGSFRERLLSIRLDLAAQTQFHNPMVTVIMPCFNEEDVIEVSLGHLLKSSYPYLEIIVIDDGSTDSTYTKAQHLASLAPIGRMRVFAQSNAGKAAALNHGLMRASGDLILCVDADSRIAPGSIEAGIRHFVRPEVGAVAGFIRIGNQGNLLLKLQQLEYLVGLNFTRRAMSFLGMVPIIPGPAGMFRREAIFEAGGFKVDERLFAEDAELTLRLLVAGWVIKSEEKMIAVTEAPETHQALLRQRYRWNRGTYQALAKNLSPLVGRLGLRGLWLATYLWGEIVVTPTLNFGLIVYFFGYFARTGEVAMFTEWFVYLTLLDLMTTSLVTYREGRWLNWIFLSIINKFYFYYLLLTWRIFCLHEEWHEQKMSWDKLERTGNLESA